LNILRRVNFLIPSRSWKIEPNSLIIASAYSYKKGFQGISGVPKIMDNYNPATWMLEVSSSSVEAQLGINFAHIYKESNLYK
jgi:hypothetical protein